MRWIPLQSISTRKWKLSVIYDDCMSYDVTEIESEHVEKILSYTAYMNEDIPDGIDPAMLTQLSELKDKYHTADRLRQKFPK